MVISHYRFGIGIVALTHTGMPKTLLAHQSPVMGQRNLRTWIAFVLDMGVDKFT
jgi:hypothetical protein